MIGLDMLLKVYYAFQIKKKSKLSISRILGSSKLRSRFIVEVMSVGKDLIIFAILVAYSLNQISKGLDSGQGDQTSSDETVFLGISMTLLIFFVIVVYVTIS